MKKNIKGKLFMICESTIIALLSFSCFTMAWFLPSHSSTFRFSTGGLKVSNIKTSVYKYVYPPLVGGGSNIEYDYNKEGVVNKVDITNTSNSLEMNYFDPTLLKIYATSSNKKTISDLNTNLVIAINFDITYGTGINISLTANKVKNNTTNLKNSDYIHFTALSSVEYQKLYGSSSLIFNNVKSYSEDFINHPAKIFNTAQKEVDNEALPILTDGIKDNIKLIDAPLNETTSNFSIYLNVDYDDKLTNGINLDGLVNNKYNLYSLDKIGNFYDMVMDYYFVFKFIQA